MSHIYRVRAVSSGWSGGPGLNTFYFGLGASAEGVPGAQLCVDRVRAGFQAARDAYATGWSCQVSNQVDVIDTDQGALVETFVPTIPAVVTGNNISGFGPLPAMLMLQLRTATVHDGSRIAGRAYLGPTGQGTDTNGTPYVGQVALANAMAAALLDDGLFINPYLVVWRRPRAADATRKNVASRTARDGTAAPVTSITVPDKFAVLTSRRD